MPEETALCSVKVGVTREGQLAGMFHGYEPVDPKYARVVRTTTTTDSYLDLSHQLPATPGLIVPDGSGAAYHYFTDPQKRAVLCVHCRDKYVDHVRLRRGLWGPITDAAKVPTRMITHFLTKNAATSHGVELGCGRGRILNAYGPAHAEEKREDVTILRYCWQHSSVPAALEITLQHERVVEIFMQKAAFEEGMRPLHGGVPPEWLEVGTLEAELESQVLGKELRKVLREARQHVAAGRERAAAPLLRTVGDSLEKAYQTACAGGEESWFGPRVGSSQQSEGTPHAVQVLLMLASVRSMSGDGDSVVENLVRAWRLLQGASNYDNKQIRRLVCAVSARLAALGVPEYLEEIKTGVRVEPSIQPDKAAEE